MLWPGPSFGKVWQGFEKLLVVGQFQDLAIVEVRLGNREWLKPAKIRTLKAP